MKLFFLAIAFVATSVSANELDLNADLNNSRQLTLSCIDKATLADAPGLEYLLVINNERTAAVVLSRPVRMRGQNPNAQWKVEDSSSPVRSLQDDALFISKKQTETSMTVDWQNEPNCYKAVPSFAISLKINEGGNYSGEIDRTGNILVNPVALCNVPRIARAMPTQLVCGMY